jgi:hypothetical protein
LVSPLRVRQAVRAPLGSALRLSQPLSGFRFDQVPRPYFVPQPFLDCPPSEPSPRRGRAPLSRPLVLPCSYPPCPGDASPATLSPPVSPTPTFERSRLDPPRTMSSLSTRPKPRFPVALGHRQRSRPLCQLHLLRSLDPSLSPFALTRASPSRVADALLVFRPSKDTYRPSLGTSNPPEPSRARALPGPRRNRLATLGTV